MSGQTSVLPELLGQVGRTYRYRRWLEEGLQNLGSGPCPPLQRMVSYHLGFEDENGRRLTSYPGKLLRPSLLLFTCEALGGEPEAALPAAVALELVHSFSLVHDDIQDQDEERHGRPTAWRLFGPAQAINLGDGLRELGALALFELGRHFPSEVVLEASKLLSRATLEMIEGQVLDLALEAKAEATLKEYEAMALRKTGALLGAALGLGALLAGADDKMIAAFKGFGLLLGLAFQGRDDLLGIWGKQAQMGKAPKTDLLRRKKSLPIVLGLEREGAEGPLHEIYRGEALDEADLPRLIGLLEGLNGRGEAEAKVREYCHQALAGLEGLGLPDWARAEMAGLIRFLAVREF
ncbi:MAG: polyprenyl synthetase family protein [Candidatus Bipolaricaulia bacterium]